ncbi:MAG: peptide chain release factor-like protein [Atopobiaceae bacterium]|nr:peptide chain release factor-like protein [Atopobiaceae bacterium]
MESKGMTYRDYARLARLPLDDLAAQCEAETFHASGPGGQGVNTADSAVRMRHLPTGIVVVSRESRSQYRNRQLCLRKIREELLRRSVPPKARVETRPTRSSVERRLAEKRLCSRTKRLRGRPEDE